MRGALVLAILIVAACGQRDVAPVSANESARIANQIDAQAKQIAAQAENGTAAIEQALENEGAAIFENRAALLNETAPAPAVTGNRQR